MIYRDYQIGDLVTKLDGIGLIHKINHFINEETVEVIHHREDITEFLKYSDIRPLTETEKSTLIVDESINDLCIVKLASVVHDSTTLNLISNTKSTYVFDLDKIYDTIGILNSHKVLNETPIRVYGNLEYIKTLIYRLKHQKVNKFHTNDFSYKSNKLPINALVKVIYRVELIKIR